MAELESCDRDHLACNVENKLLCGLSRKCLLSPALDKDFTTKVKL